MSEVKKVKTREEIFSEHKWKVEKIYSSIKEWEQAFEELKVLGPELNKFQGKINEGRYLLEFLTLREKVYRLAGKVIVYASLRSDEDTANTEHQSIKNKAYSYLAELNSYTAFFNPELLNLPNGVVEDFIKGTEELKIYEFYLMDILKMKPHTLSKEQEQLLASVSDCLQSSSNIFNMLSNADMTFPIVKDEKGNHVELTESNYNSFIRSKDKGVREEAFKALFSTYEKYKNTLSATLTSSIKKAVFESKIRNYSSTLESSLMPNNIPVQVYHNTVDTVNKNIEALHRYVKIKKKLLKLDEMHMYDLYVPIIDTPKESIEFHQGLKLINQGLKPLGEEYLDIFNNGVNEGWIDVFNNKGKRGGAYSSGDYDTMPYILLNYNYELNDVSTLAHEMGHSIHSYYSRINQPYIYSDYSLFCAEVASTTNEILLINYLIQNEQDKTKKLYLINSQLEQIRTTVFRQVMFAEFELITHERIEEGDSLTSADLCQIWHELNVKYFGSDMVVDKEIDMEWARIPHFYRDFYVYQYATGYAAANSFASMILNKEKNAVENYIGFLKSGASDYPINVLKTAGVNMLTPKPLEDTIDTFNKLLDMIEAL